MSGTEGTFPKSDDEFLWASEINSMQYKSYDAEKHTWFPVRGDIVPGSLIVNVIIAHSSSIWTGTELRTTDAGLTWAAETMCTDLSAKNIAKACDANRAYAMAWDGTTNKIRITSDSGATWADASTNPPNCSYITSMDFPTTTRAVIWGDASSGAGVWYSTDGGDNWTQATGTTNGSVVIGSMYDATNGFAVDDNDTTLYVSSDGGQTWSDSTKEAGTAGSASGIIIAISATAYIQHLGGYIWTGTTSASASQVCYFIAPDKTSNFLEITNGNIYFTANYTFGGKGIVFLYKSKDNGATWERCNLGHMYYYAVDVPITIDEYDTNKIIIPDYSGVMLIDESYGDEV